MALSIDISKTDSRTCTVKLDGMLDTEGAQLLETRISELLIDNSLQNLRMELQALSFLGSMALGAFAKIRKTMASRGGVMLLIGAQPQIKRVFDIVKMMPPETVFATRQEADDYLAAIQKSVLEESRPLPSANL